MSRPFGSALLPHARYANRARIGAEPPRQGTSTSIVDAPRFQCHRLDSNGYRGRETMALKAMLRQ
ncbi:hypothetical protein NA66_100996 [Burkholderia pyrrocinia]|uniref:Uncharacterized protein n=1 Tax=Burkholderia pyrrocinia TaxID=60550 RepID=A0A318J4E9_BURPY|nr:hypothetical protein NA66_100996 [Burkholderia pyrrocinia]SFW64465.1 hypothetical protein SAMN03159384_03480 [Burkholderia sp. NFACC33-1]SFY22622.1 hypothetical protein SAMN03159408_03688 [Burkholderia sp. NFPP32]